MEKKPDKKEWTMPTAAKFGIFNTAISSFKKRKNMFEQELQKSSADGTIHKLALIGCSSIVSLNEKEKPTTSTQKGKGRKRGRKQLRLDSSDDELEAEIVGEVQKSESLIKIPELPVKKRAPRRDAKTRKLLSSLEQMTNELSRKQSILEMQDFRNNLMIDRLEDNKLEVVPDKNPLIPVKFKWASRIFRIEMREHQSFSAVIKDVAKEMNVEESLVVLFIKDKVVKPRESPFDLSVGIATIIDCGVTNAKSAEGEGSDTDDEDDNMLNIFIQAKDQRQKDEFRIKKHAPFSELRLEYANSKGVEASKVRFVFDGDDVEWDSTPLDLDLEGDECFDVIIR